MDASFPCMAKGPRWDISAAARTSGSIGFPDRQIHRARGKGVVDVTPMRHSWEYRKRKHRRGSGSGDHLGVTPRRERSGWDLHPAGATATGSREAPASGRPRGVARDPVRSGGGGGRARQGGAVPRFSRSGGWGHRPAVGGHRRGHSGKAASPASYRPKRRRGSPGVQSWRNWLPSPIQRARSSRAWPSSSWRGSQAARPATHVPFRIPQRVSQRPRIGAGLGGSGSGVGTYRDRSVPDQADPSEGHTIHRHVEYDLDERVGDPGHHFGHHRGKRSAAYSLVHATYSSRIRPGGTEASRRVPVRSVRRSSSSIPSA